MRLSMSTTCKQAQPLVNFRGRRLNLESFFHRKDKVIFVMGATGTGKSRLAMDLANRILAEIVDSDKMQAYKGHDIVTNNVIEEECRGVPHHLIGTIDQNANFTAIDFRPHASLAVESIVGRGRLPIIAGGSNSYIEAMVNEDPEFQSRYECCFLWVDVSLPVLNSFVSERVDKMVEAGLVGEVGKMFKANADFSRGIRRASGVHEMDECFLNATIVNEEACARLLGASITKRKIRATLLMFLWCFLPILMHRFMFLVYSINIIISKTRFLRMSKLAVLGFLCDSPTYVNHDPLDLYISASIISP